MNTKLAGAVVVVTGGAALAQEGSATWLWNVTTQDGDAVVEPGETATVTFSIDMDPDVDYPDGPVLGLDAAFFDTLGGRNADKGTILTWSVLSNLDMTFGDLTTSDGHSLFGTLAAQSAIEGPFSPADPIPVVKFEWAPLLYSEFVVSYATSTGNFVTGEPREIYVWEGDGVNEFLPVIWQVTEAEPFFLVVPGPTGPVVLGALCVVLVNGRRRGEGG